MCGRHRVVSPPLQKIVRSTLLPLSPARPAAAVFRVEMLAAKVLTKQFGVRAISKTKHDVIFVTPSHAVATRREREDATEFVLDVVALTRDVIGGHGDLIRPVAIDFAARQLAFTPSHRKSPSHAPVVPYVAEALKRGSTEFAGVGIVGVGLMMGHRLCASHAGVYAHSSPRPLSSFLIDGAVA
jgi:hypothetical protein